MAYGNQQKEDERVKMEIRKARKEDIKASIGWARDIYPVRKTAEEA